MAIKIPKAPKSVKARAPKIKAMKMPKMKIGFGAKRGPKKSSFIKG